MGCRDGKKVRVHPRDEPAQFVRVNGFTRPIHYLQVVAWIILLMFALLYFGIIAPAVSMPWKPAAFVCTGLLYVIHLITHFVATMKNPADKSAKAQLKQNRQMPEFDRSKHQHVIENEYCHLCQSYVSKSSKHCRACNKCVVDFDHHCLWLNNCVGGLNYKYFLTTIATAFIATLVILTVSMFVFINSFLGYQLLDPALWWKDNLPELFQVFMGILIVLCLICSILLGQLLFFHLYLIRRGLTTYEYIQNSRAKKEDKEKSIDSVNNVDENDVSAHSRPPSVVDTAVLNTTNSAVIVKVVKTHEIVEIENQTASSDTFMATRSAAMNDNAQTESAHGGRPPTPSRAEFTNAAFSADESKHFNMNSNAKQIPQLSVNGTNNHSSSLGELRPWDNSLEAHPHPSSPKGSAENHNGAIISMTVEAKTGSEYLMPSAAVEFGSDKALRQKRKRRSKKVLMGRDDSLPRPLPVLPENSNPPLSHGSPRNKTVLPPLQNSVEWSSLEDLQSIISSQRKLPSITPSSSVNSFASFVSGSVASHRHGDLSHA